ncbi:hypothetical protein ABK040_009257 [Willaertia magna]
MLNSQPYLESPFHTPSKTLPAPIFFSEEEEQDNYLNNSNELLLEKIADQEISFVDEQMELHDVFQELTEEDIENISILKSPEQTPRYTPRLNKHQYIKKTNEATVLELTKLVNHLKNDRPSIFQIILTSKITIIFIILTALLWVSRHKPYCTPNLPSLMPCTSCPPNSNCNAFRIESCSNGYYLKENKICIRNDSTGELGFHLATYNKYMLELLAYSKDCLGRGNEKKIEEDTLFYILLNENLHLTNENKEYSVVKNPDVALSHGFDVMKRLIEDNPGYFHIARDIDGNFYSYAYSGAFSCIFTTRHFHYLQFKVNYLFQSPYDVFVEKSKFNQPTVSVEIPVEKVEENTVENVDLTAAVNETVDMTTDNTIENVTNNTETTTTTENISSTNEEEEGNGGGDKDYF